jgi:nucleotide-binding universal stress UspA family protein
VPLLIVPHPLLADERQAAGAGPVLVGYDGSAGARGALAGFAARRGAALIIVGSRGRSAWGEILLGSVAMAVLHHAERPVLTVPGADRFAGLG